jgi:membrane protease YdiL (CAAX protease family)
VSVRWLFSVPLIYTIQSATNGLVNGTLLLNILQMCVVIGLILMVFGKARLSDLGLLPQQILPAALVSLLTWVAIHVAMIGFNVVASLPIEIRPEFKTIPTAMPQLGVLISQLLGNALYEETFFRGVLLIQLVLWLCPNSSISNTDGWSISISNATRGWFVVAWIASQLVFSLQHIPNRLQYGAMTGSVLLDVAVLFVAGMLFASIFWRTQNLMIVVGLHSLSNSPTCLLAGPDWLPHAVIILVIILLLFFGPGKQRKPCGVAIRS